MTIANEKLLTASDRYMLVRVEPGFVGEFTQISGTDWELTFTDYPVSRVVRQGVELTKVSSLSGNDQYTYDETTGTVTIRVASDINEDAAGKDNWVIVYYYMFFTGTKSRYSYSTPTDSNTNLVSWEPLISNYPSILQNYSDILNGVLSIADTSVELIVDSDFWNQFNGTRHTLYNKKIDIWLCINSDSNIAYIYSGRIKSWTRTQNSIDLQASDSLFELRQDATLGDLNTQTRYLKSEYPNLAPNVENKPIPFIFGNYSRYRVIATSQYGYDISEANESFCVSYSTTKSTTTNREWVLCRTEGNIKTQSFGTINSTALVGSERAVSFSSLNNVRIGDTFQWTESSTTYYGIVSRASSFLTYNLLAKDPASPFTTSSTMTANPSMAIMINDGQTNIFPRYNRDYTLSSTTTAAGHKLHKITFVNNFEANFPGFGPLDPDAHKVFYRVDPVDTGTTAHQIDRVLYKILSAAGLEAGFTPSSTTSDMVFQIPFYDEDEYGSYLDYLQVILGGGLYYIYQDNEQKINYGQLSISPSGEERTARDMLDFTASSRCEYQDIITEIYYSNPHAENDDPKNSTTSVFAKSDRAKALNSITKSATVNHVFNNVPTPSILGQNMAVTILRIRNTRYLKISFGTSSIDANTVLSQNLILRNTSIVDPAFDWPIKVIGIDKSPQKTVIEGTDLNYSPY